MNVLPFVYCNNGGIDNFGDCLNIEIFRKFCSAKIMMAAPETAEVIGIGSLMEMLLAAGDSCCDFDKPIRVFSTGFGYAEGEHPHRKIEQPERLIRNVNCYAVRGKLTKARLESITGRELKDAVIADGGLLASFLAGDTAEKKKYCLGIIPHLLDAGNPVWNRIRERVENSILLDVTSSREVFLRSLAQCGTVISSGLHPLIACDSIGVPNRWVRVSENPSAYKFADYYSSYDLEKAPLMIQDDMNYKEDLVKIVLKEYNIPRKCVEAKKRALIEAFQNLNADLKKEIGIMGNMKYWGQYLHKLTRYYLKKR